MYRAMGIAPYLLNAFNPSARCTPNDGNPQA